MRVYDVERRVGKVEGVHIAGSEIDVVDAGRVPSCLLDHIRRRVDADHTPGRDPISDVDRDRPRPATHVEHPRAANKSRRDIGRGVLDGAPAMRSQHALVVTVGVRHAAMIARAWASSVCR
jgi:hypothetical protein